MHAVIKSIAAFARISSHINEKNERIADGLDVVYADGTAGRFDPTGVPDLVSECLGRIVEQTIEDPLAPEQVPIIAMMDLPYTVSLSWREMAAAFDIEPTAKGPGDVYSLRLMRDGRIMAIMYDMRHICPRGIGAMADAVGVDRDGTPLQDCRIMRAYYLMVSESHNLWDEKKGDLLGSSVLTLTALARHEVGETISKLTYNRRMHGRLVARSLGKDYALDASREAAKTYEEYATRRACMRGGFAFVSAREAGRVHGRGLSIDETSAYHAQVMCRYVPEGFKPRTASWLQAAAEKIVEKTPDAVMAAYHMPFPWYIHAQIEFEGLRLRRGTVFEAQEIGLMGTPRLYASSGVMGVDNAAAVEAERGVRDAGYRDTVEGGRFAFAKIMEADRVVTWVTEQELWCISQVYEWDRMTALQGEAATKRKRPDDLAILTSMRFWKEKAGLKAAIAHEQDPARKASFTARYTAEVKPKFNAIGYGLHARDEYRPSWKIDHEGNWSLEETISSENFEKRRPKRPKAWATYGMRIAGGARMHLILAMQLIWNRFGDDARILAGDTDSLKIRTDLDPQDIVAALEPLHNMTRKAIDRVTGRAWGLFPRECDDMDGVGEFVVEEEFDHIYVANIKQYVTIDPSGAIDLTLAGVPKGGEWSFGAWLHQMVDRYSPKILERVFTWGVVLSPSVSQLTGIDYADVDIEGHRLPQLMHVSYTLDDPIDPENAATIRWQRDHGRPQRVDGIAQATWRDAGAVFMYTDGEL
jgi:hypothetical protein